MSVIFVFGSNTEGRHSKGDALTAKLKYKAIYGQPEGRQGNAYGIITKELRPWAPPITLVDIKYGVDRFIHYANNHREDLFIITKIESGLTRFDWKSQIEPLFKLVPPNCTFF